MLNEHPDQVVNRRPLAPVIDEETADAIGAAIAENLGELERALERKFEQKFRDLEHKFELAIAKTDARLEAFIHPRGRRR